MNTPSEIVNAFSQSGWKNNDPMGQVLALRREDQAALAELVVRFLDSGLAHATFIDAALDLMDDGAYEATLRHAWQRSLDGRADEALAEVLGSAALQWPALFAGGWEHLLSAGAGAPRFNTHYAWRALDEGTARDWLERLGQDFAEGRAGRDRAMALLHTRRPGFIRETWQHAFAGQPGMETGPWMMLLGYIPEAGGLRPLHGERPRHIGFSASQRIRMSDSQPDMQLDSALPQEDGGEWLWGSGGCNYSFWCAGCRVSAHFWQCT